MAEVGGPALGSGPRLGSDRLGAGQPEGAVVPVEGAQGPCLAGPLRRKALPGWLR